MTILTPRTRARAAALAVLPLLLTACGGGDDSDDANDSGGSGDVSSAAGDVPALQGEDCDADVTLSGAVEDSWSGGAKVDESEEVAPPATYQSIHDDDMLTVSAVGNGFDDEGVYLLVDGRTFAVPFGTGSVDVAADGSGATIDADATEVGTDEVVRVTATFTC